MVETSAIRVTFRGCEKETCASFFNGFAVQAEALPRHRVAPWLSHDPPETQGRRECRVSQPHPWPHVRLEKAHERGHRRFFAKGPDRNWCDVRAGQINCDSSRCLGLAISWLTKEKPDASYLTQPTHIWPKVATAICSKSWALLRRHGSVDHLTTRTGQAANCTMRSARLPISRSYSAECPVAPIAIRSAPILGARSTITRTG